ncbi:MAG: GtrA family protein [Clostridia bacterium]|nr:GtrA family protein [Clostridia bacterium]
MEKLIEKLKELLRNPSLGGLLQFIKFGLVGVSNTLISYSIEMLCYYVLFAASPMQESVKIFVTSLIAFIISVTNSYYWNNRFVFKSGAKLKVREHLGRYLRTVVCYGLTGMLLAPVMKMWLSGIGVPYWLASMGTLIVTIPLNFVMNKFWAFK